MAITPADIELLTFTQVKHGYNPQEVDQALEDIVQAVHQMLEKIADLKSRLTESDSALEEARSQVGELESQLAEAPREEPKKDSDAVLATERQISQALIAAQQTAERIVDEAKEKAGEIRSDADQKAREVIRQAIDEKQIELDEIDRLKTSLDNFKKQYKQMLQEFMDEAGKKMDRVNFEQAPAAKEVSSHAESASDASGADADATILATPVSGMSDFEMDDLD